MSKYFVGLNIVPDQYCCKPGEFLFITLVLIKLANANKLIKNGNCFDNATC